MRNIFGYIGLGLLGPLAACSNAQLDDSVVEVAGLTQNTTSPVPLWFGGNPSQCGRVSPDDVKTVSQSNGDEQRSYAPDDPDAGHPGCPGGYVVDFKVPQKHPNWNHAFMHAAYTEEVCDNLLWHNQIVYLIKKPIESGGPELVQKVSHVSWWFDGAQCVRQSIDDVPEISIPHTSEILRVRIATQFGYGDENGTEESRVGLPQMVYMQTFNE